MSFLGKKLKRNLGSITRLARTGSFRGLRKDVRTVSQTTRLQSCRIGKQGPGQDPSED